MPKNPNQQFEALFAEAKIAGMTAAQACVPVPMIVGTPTTVFGNEIDPEKPVYVVEGGVCGFAWIKVIPGTSSFAKWLVKSGYARKGYGGGVDISVKEFGQSMQKKESYAGAFAKILNAAGITAYSQSRMD